MSRPARTGLRITTILVSMVVGVVTVILVICIALFLTRYRNAIVQNARTSSAQAVTQVSNTVANYLQDMDQAMQNAIAALGEPAGTRDDMLNSLLQFRPDVVAVTSYDAGGGLLDCWALGHQPKASILQNLSFDAEQAASGADLFMTAPHVETIFDGYYPWVVTMTARLPGGGPEAWVSLDLSFSRLSSYINNVGIGTRGYCFLLDADGNIVYHPQQQLIYSGLKAEDTARLSQMQDGVYDDDTIIYCLNSVEGSAWRVVGVSYVDELVDRNMAEMMQLSGLLGVVVLAAAVLTSWLLSRLLDRPLRGLAAAMENFESDADHFSYHPVGGTREVQELSNSFGHMVLRIQQLMNTVREEEINLRKTELKALQAQINPHFLYNTLDSIAWMCEQGRNADAVRMVHALARLFRISISKGHELIPIRREIEHAESYLQIQKYRYKNQFTYRFQVDPACLDYLCNKITLQPIIENAINHGLDLMVEQGHIDVQVQQDGADIVFRVIDDGVGMSQEQADAILHSEPGDRTGIGIKNVNDRLQIYFGRQYGLHIHSVPDEGTCVEIRMPKVTKEADYEAK